MAETATEKKRRRIEDSDEEPIVDSMQVAPKVKPQDPTPTPTPTPTPIPIPIPIPTSKPSQSTPIRRPTRKISSDEDESSDDESSEDHVVRLSDKQKTPLKKSAAPSSSLSSAPSAKKATPTKPTPSAAKKQSPAPSSKKKPMDSDSDSDSESSDEDDDYRDDNDIGAGKSNKKTTPAKKSAPPTKATPTKATPTKATPTKATPTKATPTKATNAKATAMKEEDMPISAPKATSKATPKSSATAAKKDESDSQTPKPLKQAAAAKSATKKSTPAKTEIKDEDDDFSSPTPASKKRRTSATPSSSQSSKKSKVSTSDSEEEDEDDGKAPWWANQGSSNPDGIQWTSLEHNGVYFPPEYVPHGIKMKYDGKPITLPAEAEEVATMFAAMLESDYAQKEVFQNNFFRDWKEILVKHKISTIQDFKKCDFSPIHKHLQELKEVKKAMTKEEKDAIKAEKAKIDEHYGFCLLDGRKEKVGNFRVEPPGLFRGRGDHPKQGTLKKRIYPEDVTINISKGAPVPQTLAGHKWKEVVHDQKVTWLAYWIENVQGGYKYVWLSAASSIKQKADMEKFEVARRLKEHIDSIRKAYTKDLKSKAALERQRATALYFIDKLALRVGNEKDSEEADTVGCCSLRVEHIKLVEGNKVEFDFLGKDSMRYYNVVEVSKDVYSNLKDFAKGKKPGDDLFDEINPSLLNAHLKKLMPKLTAKVFRTFNASFTLQRLLNEELDSKATIDQKNHFFQKANREVAILCNHQRSLPKSFQSQMEKADEKIQQLEDHHAVLEKILKKLKSGADLPKTLLEEYAVTKSLKSKDAEKEKTPKKETAPKLTVDSVKAKIEKLKGRIEQEKVRKQIKDDTKTVSLSTSKVNYLDPRITVAWCKMHNFPVEKIFNKSLMSKFPWAMEVDADWQF